MVSSAQASFTGAFLVRTGFFFGTVSHNAFVHSLVFLGVHPMMALTQIFVLGECFYNLGAIKVKFIVLCLATILLELL